MDNRPYKKLIIGICVLGLYACVKDKPETKPNLPVLLSNAQKVMVVNEGNFQNGNASVSLYDTESGVVIDDYYQAQNAQTLGDVAQSLIWHNGSYYTVVNNSGKVVVSDASYKRKASISGLNSPRYMLPINNSKAYVSDLYANAIHIINLASNTKTGEIECKGWTEQMVYSYGKAFVCNVKRNYVYVINTINDAISDSIAVGANAYSLVIDKYEKLWVLSNGDKTKGLAAQLSRINPLNNQLEQSFTFPLTETPSNLVLNESKDELLFLNKGIQRLPCEATSFLRTTLLNSTQNFYGLAVNPKNGDVYVSDALDYVQKSSIYIYDANGVLKKSFKAGINASGFWFGF